MISEFRLIQLRAMLENGTSDRFYDWPEWAQVRIDVLNLDNHECQICKHYGRVGPSDLVHHVKPLKTRPDLALSVFDPDTGERQLITVCRSCHEVLHPERMRRKNIVFVPPLTEERWD